MIFKRHLTSAPIKTVYIRVKYMTSVWYLFNTLEKHQHVNPKPKDRAPRQQPSCDQSLLTPTTYVFSIQ